MSGYGGRRRLPDGGELVGIVVLLVMGMWGAWFGVQSLMTLWWPNNVSYFVAGALVAAISAAAARAMLNR